MRPSAVSSPDATASTASSASSQNILSFAGRSLAPSLIVRYDVSSERTVGVSSSQLCLEQPAELPFGAVQLGLDRAERKVQLLGQILILYAVQVMRGDEQLVVRRQPR